MLPVVSLQLVTWVILSDVANDEDTCGVPLKEFLADSEINNRELKDYGIKVVASIKGFRSQWLTYSRLPPRLHLASTGFCDDLVMMSCVNKNEHVPLSVLLKRELVNEKADRPEIVCAQANQSKKGEDFALIKTDCHRALGDALTTYSVFGIFDGHNGSAAAIYTKENLLNNVLCALPPDLNRDEWVAALPRALVAAFVKTDKDFQDKAQMSGTTVTFVIIEGLIVTVASVGDSRCILESADGSIYHLSADHRLDTNEEERERVTACGGEVGRLNTGAGTE
ncbi:probable protein phosphatase 2C 12, partial [Tanacetum coccineum]